MVYHSPPFIRRNIARCAYALGSAGISLSTPFAFNLHILRPLSVRSVDCLRHRRQQPVQLPRLRKHGASVANCTALFSQNRSVCPLRSYSRESAFCIPACKGTTSTNPYRLLHRPLSKHPLPTTALIVQFVLNVHRYSFYCLLLIAGCCLR